MANKMRVNSYDSALVREHGFIPDPPVVFIIIFSTVHLERGVFCNKIFHELYLVFFLIFLPFANVDDVSRQAGD